MLQKPCSGHPCWAEDTVAVVVVLAVEEALVAAVSVVLAEAAVAAAVPEEAGKSI